MTKGQITHNQITWSDCLLGISLILSGSPLEAGYFGAVYVQLATRAELFEAGLR